MLKMSNTGGYDRGLLAEAPEASKAERQEGYNVNLLDRDRGDATSPHTHPPPRSVSNHDGNFIPRQGKADYSSPYQEFSGGPKTIPFWRTAKGMIIIAVLTVVVLGAAIGGGVGGGLSHGNHGNRTSSNLGSGSDTNQGTSPQSASTVVGQNVATSAVSALHRATPFPTSGDTRM